MSFVLTLRLPSAICCCRTSSREPFGPRFQAGRPLSKTSFISSSVLPLVSGAVRNMCINARPLKAPKRKYMRQLMVHSNGGTAKARTQFQAQFEAVARDTAFART